MFSRQSAQAEANGRQEEGAAGPSRVGSVGGTASVQNEHCSFSGADAPHSIKPTPPSVPLNDAAPKSGPGPSSAAALKCASHSKEKGIGTSGGAAPKPSGKRTAAVAATGGGKATAAPSGVSLLEEPSLKRRRMAVSESEKSRRLVGDRVWKLHSVKFQNVRFKCKLGCT